VPVEFEILPLTPEDRLWSAKAQELELGALAAMRGSAEKWAAALTGALGVVSLTALLTGPTTFKSLSADAKIVAEIAFFLAAVLALVAAALATLAAQTTQTKIVGGSGTQFKQWAASQIDKWQPFISASRWLAAFAVLFVLISAGVLWFGDRTKPGPTVIDAQGSALCPHGPSGTTVTIEEADYLLRCGK
jgi:drug/metabolite transporter superfamily protein YnfA